MINNFTINNSLTNNLDELQSWLTSDAKAQLATP